LGLGISTVLLVYAGLYILLLWPRSMTHLDLAWTANAQTHYALPATHTGNAYLSHLPTFRLCLTGSSIAVDASASSPPTLAAAFLPTALPSRILRNITDYCTASRKRVRRAALRCQLPAMLPPCRPPASARRVVRAANSSSDFCVVPAAARYYARCALRPYMPTGLLAR